MDLFLSELPFAPHVRTSPLRCKMEILSFLKTLRKRVLARTLVFIDAEIGVEDQKIHDLGALREDQTCFHSGSVQDFLAFIADADYVCGHNILQHDLSYITRALGCKLQAESIDTLPLSPLLFPRRPYHALLKDDKLQVEELNNPVCDCRKAASLFYDEVNAFQALPRQMQDIYAGLLQDRPLFRAFFAYVGFSWKGTDLEARIHEAFAGKICSHADLAALRARSPEALAYALALIGTDDPCSVTPAWVLHHYPQIGNFLHLLRHNPCGRDCPYCSATLDIHKGLREIFGFEAFRTYNGEPLQEQAALAAVQGKSLLAVFPTGGGKSITFQLPALMAGQCVHGLTVVISPLLSLMKDQVDNLDSAGITEAVTINGLLDPLERARALERIADGSASIVYISPELLRSRTLERVLSFRTIVRFVIDEAHCFSAWGQDFRVDYQYIGTFIRELQEKRGLETSIPVSCFTATAKQKVISDIRDYFRKTLNLDLELFASGATRENLHYAVLYKENDAEKYAALRELIGNRNCPAIVYVSRTRQTVALADKLASDGFAARPFHGRMDAAEKVQNQEAFMRNEVQVIVATSAFGMGVDKKDVGLVVHYDISSSLEDYVQEAGRAGRDPSLQAECYVLYNDSDLDKHFILLNQSKLSISEIQQVWRAIKTLCGRRQFVSCSALEIAREAGWDDSVRDVETRVRTAVAALENAGYVKRGQNVPHVYATGIQAKSMIEAGLRLEQSPLFSEGELLNARRILAALIASRSRARAGTEEAESRVDYLADRLGLQRREVVSLISLMRQEGLLSDTQDMSASILATDTENRAAHLLERFARLEGFLLSRLTAEGADFNLKKLNEEAQAQGLASSVKDLRTLISYHVVRKWMQKFEYRADSLVRLVPVLDPDTLRKRFRLRISLCRFIISTLFGEARHQQASPVQTGQNELRPVSFSVVGLLERYQKKARASLCAEKIVLADVEDALLYLSRTGGMKLEGGFLVLYNALQIRRLVTDNRIRYKLEDYRLFDEFYKQKIRQIHIVGHYANLMVRDYAAALQFVQDYFQMDFRRFIARYFREEQAAELNRAISAKKYRQLFGELSSVQQQIINDDRSRYIVVAAGPGSGKTRVLVHKLASLLLLEDVKQEQLLMLTFSRAAATEFRKRLTALIGPAAHYVEIKTFHSFSFDLLGRVGSLEGSEDVVARAVAMIAEGGVEPGRLTRSVLVIDEAQDMSASEFALVRALMEHNETMRLVAVGDDDQNIFEFRGSDSRYLRALVEEYGATQYEMTDNYRSAAPIVALANAFVTTIGQRMKSEPIRAVPGTTRTSGDGQDGAQEAGQVCVTRHRCSHMEEALAEELIAMRPQAGSCCVLTWTNNEALQIASLLLRKGVRARLIQSLDGLRLYNLVEIRYFLKQIELRRLQSPVISDDVWNMARQKLTETYAASTALSSCLRLINDFETINREKYFSDLEAFIQESGYEDFYGEEQGAVTVSTIHKAKGREFDTVFLMLNRVAADRDADRRALYVGMTRARKGLFVHTNTDLLSSLVLPGVLHRQDSRIFAESDELVLQLTHRDVVLSFFKDKKSSIFQLRSGMDLHIAGDLSLHARVQGSMRCLVLLSRACRARLGELARQGYRPCAARVRFIVAWKGREDTEETAVVLPDLYLRRVSV